MVLRTLLCSLLAGVVLLACGAPKPPTEKELCGPTGCDQCIGVACERLPDGGVP